MKKFVLTLLLLLASLSSLANAPVVDKNVAPPAPEKQTVREADAKSAG